ncbi:hypothetical protein K7X08_033962 [Anisodus acutangulus]|uniref:Uncharacterized protein n=1 Tax=Anisodus acutangulus TaxID=402998 RepID=A0A9Q1MJD7_9SOLA|nr:hypothetical protein K7X08_033962 [Anisodus acutangulus]
MRSKTIAKVFFEEAKQRIGPPFLQVMVETLRHDDAVKTCLEANKGNALVRCKHNAVKCTRGTTSGICKGVKIADSAEPGIEASCGQVDVLPTPKIYEAKEALKLSSLALRAAVKDPLPEALELVETLMSLDRNNSAQQLAENDNGRAPNLVWNGSIDDLSEESPSSGRRFTLPIPRRTKVSPLKKYEFKKVTTRRKAKRWSMLEEDTLRSGVQKYIFP